MLDGRDGKARQKAMELLVRYAEALGAERLRRHPQRGWGARLRQSVPAELLQGQGRGRPRRDLLALRSRLRRARRGAAGAWCRRSIFRAAPIPERWQTLGVKVEVFRNYQEREALRRQARRRHPQDVHAISGGQRAGQRRAPRVDGVVCRDLRQLRAGCADQHRRTREHERGDADRKDSRLGSAPDGASLRHAPHRRRRARRLGDGLGHARLLRRRRRAGADSRRRRELRPAGDRPPEALRRGGVELGRRRDVPHRRRHAGSGVARDGIRAEDASRDIHVRQGGAASCLRSTERQRAATRTWTS